MNVKKHLKGGESTAKDYTFTAYDLSAKHYRSFVIRKTAFVKCGDMYTQDAILSGKKTKLSEHNLNLIRYANNKGFTINLSADTLEQADILSDTKIPTTVVLPFTKTQFEKMEVDLSEVKTPAGKKITICPEQTQGIKCLDCKLCSHNKRKTIIGFFKH